MKTLERLRWRIAGLIDLLPGQCWSGLVDWVLRYGSEPLLPWSPIRGMCREDADRCGACYCGKLRREDGLR